MGLTQKYKQQQHQIRIQTSEANYLRGMYFTDSPLAEGYSKVVLNYDIDSNLGKLTPRKGLRTVGFTKPYNAVRDTFTETDGFNLVVNSKICASSGVIDTSRNSKILQSILYNTASKNLRAAICDSELSPDTYFDLVPLYKHTDTFDITSDPFVISEPELYGKKCVHNNFFKRPVGTFAFGNSYYTFVKKKYADATPTEYFMCYTKRAADIQDDEVLFDDTIDLNVIRQQFPESYLACIAKPERINPTEATSWGYNMLLKNPYDFVCENTAVNLVTILGVIPYDKAGAPALTPRKNQEITLKGFYRAPEQYHSNKETATFYATTKKQLTLYEVTKDTTFSAYKVYYEKNDLGYTQTTDTSPVAGKTYYERVIRDPKTYDELIKAVPGGLTDKDYGSWWFTTSENKYYMVQPVFKEASENAAPSIALWSDGTAQPPASVQLAATNSKTEDKVHIRWQFRAAGASDWINLKDGDITTTLTEYYKTHGDHAPFVLTTTLPADEVLIKLTISDPLIKDPITGEEAVISTNTIGMSLVSDELATKLNITAKNYDIAQGTGMLEWNQHLVVWGVPGALETLFVSDVNNPTFFPYPNNVDTFTEPIISVHNFGDELLVLTTSALYRLTWGTDGTGWTHTLVQQNLRVTEADARLSCVVKNMFFFKSGELFYMMVPKSSLGVKGSVAIAPISRPITELLQNFHTEVYKLISVLIDKTPLFDFTRQFVNYYTYVEGSKVIVNYVYDMLESEIPHAHDDPEHSKYLYVQLIYDTDTRAWTMKTFEAAHMIYATHADAIQQEHFMDLIPYVEFIKDECTTKAWYIQHYQFVENPKDNTYQYVTSSASGHDVAFNVELPVYKEVCTFMYTNDKIALPNKEYWIPGIWQQIHPSYGVPDVFPANFQIAVRDIDIQVYPDTSRLVGADHSAPTIHPGDDLTQFLKVCTYAEFVDNTDLYTLKLDDTNNAQLIPIDKTEEIPYYAYIIAEPSGIRLMHNYQYLDTGNRAINIDMKKRFREFQFLLKNSSGKNLSFYTSFLVDGSLRKDMQQYVPRLITDDNTNTATVVTERQLNSNAQLYTIERTLDPQALVYNTTRIERAIATAKMLQDAGETQPTTLAQEQDPDRWVLNQSAFPGRTLVKIRMPLSGKGLAPRVILLSTNEIMYNLISNCWVYRTMNSR